MVPKALSACRVALSPNFMSSVPVAACGRHGAPFSSQAGSSDSLTGARHASFRANGHQTSMKLYSYGGFRCSGASSTPQAAKKNTDDEDILVAIQDRSQMASRKLFGAFSEPRRYQISPCKGAKRSRASVSSPRTSWNLKRARHAAEPKRCRPHSRHVKLLDCRHLASRSDTMAIMVIL